MKRCAVLLTALLIACSPSATNITIPTPRACQQALVNIDGEIGAILTDQQSMPSGLATQEAITYYHGYWSRFHELRAVLLASFMQADCESARETLLTAVEEYQRECELMQAFVHTHDQEFRLRAYDARRRGDRARHGARAILFTNWPIPKDDLACPTLVPG